jgi:DNA-binding transcriptional MocR family regulator
MKTPREILKGLQEEFPGRRFEPTLFLTPIDGAEGAARILRRLIQDGTLGLQEELKAEQLRKIFGLHRNTMAKALGLLRNEGFLQGRQGRSSRIVSQRAPTAEPTRADALHLEGRHGDGPGGAGRRYGPPPRW